MIRKRVDDLVQSMIIHIQQQLARHSQATHHSKTIRLAGQQRISRADIFGSRRHPLGQPQNVLRGWGHRTNGLLNLRHLRSEPFRSHLVVVAGGDTTEHHAVFQRLKQCRNTMPSSNFAMIATGMTRRFFEQTQPIRESHWSLPVSIPQHKYDRGTSQPAASTGCSNFPLSKTSHPLGKPISTSPTKHQWVTTMADKPVHIGFFCGRSPATTKTDAPGCDEGQKRVRSPFPGGLSHPENTVHDQPGRPSGDNNRDKSHRTPRLPGRFVGRRNRRHACQ